MLIGRLAFDGHFEIDFGGCTLLRAAVNSVSIGRQSIGLPGHFLGSKIWPTANALCAPIRKLIGGTASSF
jgi:hypothetical protein